MKIVKPDLDVGECDELIYNNEMESGLDGWIHRNDRNDLEYGYLEWRSGAGINGSTDVLRSPSTLYIALMMLRKNLIGITVQYYRTWFLVHRTLLFFYRFPFEFAMMYLKEFLITGKR